MEVLAWGELSRLRNSMNAKGLSPQQAANNANAANALSPNTPGQKVYLQTGSELIRLSWLRASAAIALGRLDHTEAATPLGQFLEPPPAEDEFLVMPREFALMAQTQYPSDRARIRAMSILGRKVDGKVQLETPKDSPVRGFAALALGLFARPYDTDQGPADRPGYEAAITALAERLEDKREELEVRSACAVALGLTQRASVLPVLSRVTERSQTRSLNDVGLYGFLLLGRSMVGDQNIVGPAEQFLFGRNDDTSISGTRDASS